MPKQKFNPNGLGLHGNAKTFSPSHRPACQRERLEAKIKKQSVRVLKLKSKLRSLKAQRHSYHQCMTHASRQISLTTEILETQAKVKTSEFHGVQAVYKLALLDGYIPLLNWVHKDNRL